MVSDKELRRKTLSDYHLQNDIPEHTHDVLDVSASSTVRVRLGLEYSNTVLVRTMSAF